MRDLSIIFPLSNNTIDNSVFQKEGVDLPEIFINFINRYNDNRVKENLYIGESMWVLNDFTTTEDLIALTKEFIDAGWGKMIPFAFDPGGWHFCLCLEDGEKYGGIYVNRWTDHLPEEQFLKIADNFEDFINGLQTEEEAGL